MRTTKLDLDVESPEQVADVLRAAAEQFYASESELQSAWTDPHAGRVWRELAKIMERAATSCEVAVRKYV